MGGGILFPERMAATGRKGANPGPKGVPRGTLDRMAERTAWELEDERAPADAAREGTSVLIVDDSPTARALLREIVEGLPDVAAITEAGSAEEALRLAASSPPGVALMDLSMPGMSGIEATRELAKVAPETRVIVYSGSLDPTDVRLALEAGAAGYTVKSSDRSELSVAVAAAIHGRGVLSSEVVRPVIAHYVELLAQTRRQLRAAIESLGVAVEAKDRVTSEHLDRVAKLAVGLAREVEPKLAGEQEFLFGCLLHDIGKLGIPEELLSKPGPLSDEEWNEMRRHPEIGAQVIQPLGLGEIARAIVLHHHERWDGGGYPHELAGDAIPLPARIFAVCDALDAMTARRPYREPVGVEHALERIQEEAGGQFDPQIVGVLVHAVREGRIAAD